MTYSHFIGLVDKYIQLELANEINPAHPHSDSLLRLRARIIDQLSEYKKQQAKQLNSIAPGFFNF